MTMQGGSQGQLQEFLEIISRRRWQVVLPAALVVTVGIAFAALSPRKYEVSTRVEIRETRVEHDEQFKDAQGSATTREIANAEHHIRHTERLRGIIEADIEMWPRYQTFDRKERNFFIRNKILKNLAVNTQGRPGNQGSTFVDIVYIDVDPQRAETFVESLTEAWVRDVVDRDKTTVQAELDILQDQVHRAQRSFSDKQSKFFQLTKAMNVDPTLPLGQRVERLTDPIIADLARIEKDIFELQGELAQAEGEVSYLEDSLAQTPPEVIVGQTLDGLSFGGQVAEIEANLAAAKVKQAPLRPQHHRWGQLDAIIRALEAQLEVARGIEGEGMGLEQRVPNPQYANLVELIDEGQAAVSGLRRKFEAKTVQHKDVLAKAQQRQDDYHELLNLDRERTAAGSDLAQKRAALQQKELTMQLIANAWDRPHEIADPPIAPKSPTEPNVWLILTFSVLAGVAAGLSVAMLSEFSQPGCRTVADISRIVNAPVLGSINAIVTRSESRSLRVRRAFVSISSAVIILVTLWTTYLWHYDPAKLPSAVVQAIDAFQYQLM